MQCLQRYELSSVSICINTDQRTEGAISILDRVVAVIPCTSVLHRSKCVVEGVSWSNGTLGNTVNTVHVHCLPLSNTVPVDASAIVLQFVGDDDGNILQYC